MFYQPSFRDSISAFLRRKGLFMLAFGVACLAGGTYLLVKHPLYLSSASLVLHFESQAVPDIDRTMKPTQLQGSNEHREILYSDADILHSSGIIRDVVGKMGLARLYPAIARGPGDDAPKRDLGEQAFAANLVIGEVVMMHIADEVLDERRQIDPRKLQTVARLGGDFWCRTSDLFEQKRP